MRLLIPALVLSAIACRGEVFGGADVVTWRLEPLYTIGSVDGEHDAFGNIVSILADARGRLYVADAQAHAVRVFENGRHVRSIGGQGRGPGEITRLVGIAWLGEHLLVQDAGNARLGLFDTAGAWVDSRPHVPLTGTDVRPHRAAGDTVYVRSFRRGTERLEAVYARHTRAGVDTVPAPERDPRSAQAGVQCVGEGIIAFFDTPFTGRQVYTYAPGGLLAVVWSTEYRMAFVNAEGDTVRVVERPLVPAPLTDAEWREWRDRYREWRERMSGARCEGELARPAAKPALRHFFFDPDGRLWVERWTADGFAFDVFDTDGTPIATMTAPDRQARVEPYVRDGRLYVVVTDELDVQRVQAFRIVAP